MLGYKHILVPTDFSQQSEVAAKRAAELAKLYGARLSVLHVVDYVPPGYIRVDEPEASKEHLVQRARDALGEWIKRLGLKVANQWVEAGSAKRQIISKAKENAVDLIVLGCHGEHGLASLMVGSTTSGVLHEAPCDVLSVRQEC